MLDLKAKRAAYEAEAQQCRDVHRKATAAVAQTEARLAWLAGAVTVLNELEASEPPAGKPTGKPDLKVAEPPAEEEADESARDSARGADGRPVEADGAAGRGE